MRHEVLSKWKAIHFLRICGVMCIFLLMAASNAYPNAIADVTVNESLGGYHNLHIEGVSSSSANLSYLVGSAWAEVDIEQGTIKTFVQSTTSEVIQYTGADLNAYAKIDDYFTISGLPPGTLASITGNLNVTGHGYTTPAQSLVAYSGANGNLWGGSGFDYTLWSWPDGGEISINTVLSCNYLVYPDVPFRVEATLQSYGLGVNHYDILSDFFSTATLSFDLPDGTWISSEGGFFQSTVPIPIPSAIWLLGSGLIGLAGIRSRFKK